jgi:hypothetical protein
MGGNVPLDNPVQSLCEEVADIWCGLEAERQNKQKIELTAPSETAVVPIRSADGNVTESLLQIQLSHEGAGPRGN